MWAVTLNHGGGSMSEAMDPQEIVFVATGEEAVELEEWVSRHSENRHGEIRAIAFEVGETVSLADAKSLFEKSYLLEGDEDDDLEDARPGIDVSESVKNLRDFIRDAVDGHDPGTPIYKLGD